MKANHIHDALGLLDDALLEETNRNRYSKRRIIRPLIITTVCLSLIFISMPKKQKFTYLNMLESISTFTRIPGLPLLNGNNLNSSGGFGFESYYAYEASEILEFHPWSNHETITKLPVYLNTSSNLAGEPLINADINKLNKVLDYFNQTVAEKEVIKSETSDIIQTIHVKTEDLMISIDGHGSITIDFNQPIDLSKDSMNQEETLKNLVDQYKDLLNYVNPQISIEKSYLSDGTIHYTYIVYDQSNTLSESMINYYTNKTLFSIYDYQLMGITIKNDLSIAQKLEDYPIITKNKAYQLLEKGYYITSYSDSIYNLEDIKNVSLVYKTSYTLDVWMPYYRFLVEVESESSLKQYVTYYVPAIPLQYIEGLEIWDGTIN